MKAALKGKTKAELADLAHQLLDWHQRMYTRLENKNANQIYAFHELTGNYNSIRETFNLPPLIKQD